MADLNLLHGTVTSAASGFLIGSPPSNPGNTNDGDTSTGSVSDGWGAGGGQTRRYEWISDLGDVYEVTSFRLMDTTSGSSDLQPHYADAQHEHISYCSGSMDGVTWDNLPFTSSPASGYTEDVVHTFASPAQYRYFRYHYDEFTYSGFPNFPGITIGTWVIEGEDTPVVVDPGEPGEPSEHEPQDVARALIEIYVPDPDAYRWGVALWGESLWSSAGWVNITPLCVSADVSWGASRSEAGILAEPEAGRWTIITYDPDRVLDPGNEDSQYAPAITYGLPIRVNHRGRTIRTGYVESIEYSHESGFGVIRATDNIANLAAVSVPDDVDMHNGLFIRAHAAIDAAGSSVQVGAQPPAGDPDVADWEPGDFTAWYVIYQTALEALYIPYIDNKGVLRFASWQTPLDRGSTIGSPEMIELVAAVSADSLYSVVQTTDEADVDVERRITPLPTYGRRVFRRALRTINGGDWADVVLEDRSQSGLRWRPGDIYPLDADSVDFLQRLEVGELISIDYPEADPPVEVRARILGMRFRVVDLGGAAGPDWRWSIAASTAALSPLEADDVEPIEYLTDDDTGEYLYPDGVVGIS